MIQPKYLKREDIKTQCWEHLVADMTDRLQELREQNDSIDDHETTSKRRGRIAELKEWLALATQAQSSDAGPYGPVSFKP